MRIGRAKLDDSHTHFEREGALQSVKAPPVSGALNRASRRAALAATGRSCELEGLPPPSAVAQAMYQRWIHSMLTADQVGAVQMAGVHARNHCQQLADAARSGQRKMDRMLIDEWTHSPRTGAQRPHRGGNCRTVGRG